MAKERLTYTLLSSKAEKEKMSFSDFLGGVVLEEVVNRIANSDAAKCMWLRNSDILGKDKYIKKLQLTLEYTFILQKLPKGNSNLNSRDFLMKIGEKIKEILELDNNSGIFFEVKQKILKHCMELSIIGRIEDMQVPIRLKIYGLVDEKIAPRKECFSPMLLPEKKIEYYHYPAEKLLAERFMEIISRMELIQDMSAYYEVYYLLDHESVDGRKVKEYIDEQCTIQKLAKNKKYLDTIAEYKDYGYMKKKWKVYLRSINSVEPAWDVVMERFQRFFTPVWKAYLEDVVFFGDWMPDLNRFL